MTGIERLRRIAEAQDMRNAWTAMLSHELSDIADQIESEHKNDLVQYHVPWSKVQDVMLDMERHVSGVEGAEDSPVARWARELREALGGGETDEDREAIAWVRKHGGLDYVRAEWRSRVPRDCYERKRQRLLGHIAECETALGRRREVISELGHRVSDLTTENAELRRRAMPEGMEWLVEAWPRFEDDAPVRFSDDFDRYGDERSVSAVTVYPDGSFALNYRAYSKGERVRRPAPKVYDSDGVEIREGQTVWHIRTGEEYSVIGVPSKSVINVSKQLDGREIHGVVPPHSLTHRAPVLAADGRPLREGETVWFTTSGREMHVDKIEHRPEGFWALELFADGSKRHSAPVSILAHERPVADTWERIEEDALNFVEDNAGIPHDQDQMERDMLAILRRCRALAERGRGE